MCSDVTSENLWALQGRAIPITKLGWCLESTSIPAPRAALSPTAGPLVSRLRSARQCEGMESSPSSFVSRCGALQGRCHRCQSTEAPCLLALPGARGSPS